MKPHRTIRSMIVLPKDKRKPLQTAEVVYEIPCKSCDKSYVGETGRLLRVRLKEHHGETEKKSSGFFTRSKHKSSVASVDSFKSAMAEHATLNNHVVDWDGVKIVDQEADRTTRWLKEAIVIRNRGKQTVNTDKGAYKLDKVFDQIITTGQRFISINTRNDVTRQALKQPADRNHRQPSEQDL